jgi:tetratricopeptide (TPR) repeat protein
VTRKTLSTATLLCALACGAAARADQFAFELTVLGPDGKGVEGAAVSLAAAAGTPFTVDGTTDKKGRWETHLPDFERIYNLRVTKPDMASLEQALDLPAQGLRPRQTAEVKVTLSARGAQDAYNEGVTALRAQDMATGIQRFEEATRLDPALVVAWRALSLVYLGAQRPADALAAADRTLELAAGDAEALRNRHDALLALGRAADAEAVLDQLVATAPSPDTARLLFNSGALAWNAKNAELARRRFGQALELDPKLHQAHSAIAEIHIAASQAAADEAQKRAELEQALAAIDRAIAVAPRNFKAFERKVELLRALGRDADAVAVERQVAALKAGG